jgi:hypothetical protein
LPGTRHRARPSTRKRSSLVAVLSPRKARRLNSTVTRPQQLFHRARMHPVTEHASKNRPPGFCPVQSSRRA